VFFFRVCEGEWLRESDIDAALAEVFAHPFEVFAAFESGPRYTAVFEAKDRPIVGAAAAVVLEEGRIVELWRICGTGEAGDGLIPPGQTDFLIEPD
jgi:hypothetical protein